MNNGHKGGDQGNGEKKSGSDFYGNAQESLAAIERQLKAIAGRYETANANQQRHDESVLRVNRRTFWAVVIYAGITLGILVSSICQLRTGEEQVAVARDTEKRQLRAYVIVSTKSLNNFSLGGKASVQGVFDNVGQTPVYDGAWESGINVFTYPLRTPLLKNKSCERIVGVNGANRWFFGKQTYPFKERDALFTDYEIDQIKTGSSAVYFTGRFCYRDIFNDIHFTDFCIQWHWHGDAFAEAEYCDYGNGGDH